MEKVIAKQLWGKDMYSFMYLDKEERPGLCPVCHNVVQLIPDVNVRLRRRKGNLFTTYDHFRIVTERFKQFCEERNYQNLSFVKLDKMKGYYFFEPNDIFRIDYERSKVLFLKKRDCCGQYDEMVGGLKTLHKANDFHLESDDFIARTDLYWGSYERKDPLIIIGLETEKAMKEYGLGGLWFHDVFE